jgi:serine/threonine protein kinase
MSEGDGGPSFSLHSRPVTDTYDIAAMLGRTIDRYKIETVIGEGGFGAVYKARHLVTERRVALKILHADRAAAPDMVERFVQESKAAAAIGHPHIVEVLDAGTAPDGLYFLAMELLEGASLEDLMENQAPFAVRRAIELTLQVLEALEAAHEKNIVHRDLKPANVFVLVRDGREFAKLLDFGISKMQVPERLGTLTKVGAVLGTPQYMAPEQSIGSGKVDGRSDLYAAATLLYQMLSRRLPFEAETYQTLLLKMHTEMPVPLLHMAPGIPPLVAMVVERGLARDPDARWPNARAMSDALKGALEGNIASLNLPGATNASAPYGPSDPSTGPMVFPQVSTAPRGGVGGPWPPSAPTPWAPQSQPVFSSPAGAYTPHPATPYPRTMATPAPGTPPPGMHMPGTPVPITNVPYQTPAPHASAPYQVPPPRAPQRSSGLAIAAAGCGVLLVIAGLAAGGVAVVAWLNADSIPPPPPTDEGPGPQILEGPPRDTPRQVDDPGVQVTAIEPEHVLLSRKLAEYSESCIDRYSDRALSSRDRYLSWCARSGPTGRERHIYGLYDLSGDGRDCETAIAGAASMPPEDPELEAMATEYGAALLALVPVVSEAERYYEQSDYEDDGMARGRELHPRLLAAFDRFAAAHQPFYERVRVLESQRDDRLLAELEAQPGSERRYAVELVRVEGARVADLSLRIRLDSDRRYTGVDATELAAAVDRLEAAIDRARALASSTNDSELASYVEGADEFLGPAKELRRAVQNRTQLDGTYASWIGTSAGWMVDGSPDEYRSTYEHFLSFSYSSFAD